MDDNYLEIIKTSHQGVDNGTFVFFVKKHQGQVSTLDSQKFFTHKTVRGNEEALEIAAALIKGMQASMSSGDLTFTVHFQKGLSKKVIVQDMKRSDFINRS